MPETRPFPALLYFAAMMTVLPSHAHAAALAASPEAEHAAPMMASRAPAGMAFARYMTGLSEARPWGLETIEIEASLPKLEKRGRLRAIRRLLPAGKPEFQVLEMDGDRTVRQQVIARYLSAEVRAADIPSSSVAITPLNYKFRYQGHIENGPLKAYIFRITPRHKREGLIQGELWIDADTGSAVRQSGYLVKKPSVFVKRLEVTRETFLRDGAVEMRLTHVTVDTRLVGRGELTIHERPCSGAEGCSSTIRPVSAADSVGER